MCWIPDPGRFHMPQSNGSPCATTTRCSRAWEPQRLNLRTAATKAHAPRACAPRQERPPQWEACASEQKYFPLSATIPNLGKAMKAQWNQKKIKVIPTNKWRRNDGIRISALSNPQGNKQSRQGSANYGPWAMPGLLVFVNKVLLALTHAHSFLCWLLLLPHYHGGVD